MLDMIEHWVDTHQFLSCCLLGFMIAVMNAIDPFIKPLKIEMVRKQDEPTK
jgi:hypothetical protein